VGISRSVTSRSSGILEASRGQRTLSSFHERASTRHVDLPGRAATQDFRTAIGPCRLASRLAQGPIAQSG
jgi:hypothetical protein